MKTRKTLIGMAIILPLAALAWVLWAAPRTARPPIPAIILRALFEEESVPYTATARLTMPYCGKTIKSSVSLIHTHDAEMVTSLSRANSSAWTIKRPGGSYTYVPGDKTMLISRFSSLLTPAQRGHLLLTNYETRYEGTEQVAGQKAYIVELIPRREFGPSKKLWIGARYGSVLRSIDHSSSGNERGMEITSINYGARIDSTAFDPHPKPGTKTMIGCEPASLAELSRKVGIAITQPKYVPQGYVLEGRHLFTPSCGCCQGSAQITYTDGLNTISVFENHASAQCKNCCAPKAGKPGSCQVGGCGVTGAGRVTRGDKTIEVVGDLPASEISKIAESVD